MHNQIIEEALFHHRHGRLAEAERLYRTVLERQPARFEALHCLGVLKLQQGNPHDAVHLLSAAAKARTDATDVLASLGAAFSMLNRQEEALCVYGRILEVRPADLDALYNCGVVLSRLGRHHEALASYDKLLATRPDHAPALFNRANVLARIGHHQRALDSYDALLAADPRHFDTLLNRGNALANLRRFAESLESYDRALAIKPDHLDALNNRGNALKALGRHQEALASYERVLALQPKHADALNNRGNALIELNRYDDAIASFDRALALKPGDCKLWFNFGRALQEADRDAHAIAAFDRALAICPADADVLYSRGNSSMKLDRPADAALDYEHALAADPVHAHAFGKLLWARLDLCDWLEVARHARDLPARLADGRTVIEPFQLFCLPTSPADQLRCARTYIQHKTGAPAAPVRQSSRGNHGRIRLAYFSADFRTHVVASAIAGLIELHDRARFELIGISYGPDDDSPIRARLIRAFEQFHDVRANSREEIADLIRRLKIDILVDLTGYTRQSRTEILATQPAPVQVNYLGFPGTTGAEFIDYVIADPIVLPAEQQPFYAEHIVHLPSCYLVNDVASTPISTTPPRSLLGLPEHHFVFCAFTKTYKISAQIFDIWMRLLHAVGDSVLWLSRSTELAMANLRREAERRGVDPGRLIFAPRVVSLADHLARQQAADLYLDTFPYNAHTTAINAL